MKSTSSEAHLSNLLAMRQTNFSDSMTRAENEDGAFTANRHFPDAQWFCLAINV
jgi:hypothetical protein